MTENVTIRVINLGLNIDFLGTRNVPCQYCGKTFGFKTGCMTESSPSCSAECSVCGKTNVLTIHFPKELILKATISSG